MSQITGELIYEEIKKLNQDKQDVAKALDSIEERLGKNNAAYRMLLDAHKMADKELCKQLRKKYEEPSTAPSLDIFGGL